jgi:hypothetical protein
MNKIINLFKKQKLFIFLFLILVILLVIKLSLGPSEPETISIPSSPLPGIQTIKPEIPESSPIMSPVPSALSNVYYDPVTEALEKALEEKPWLLELPIASKNYTIDYLGQEKGFRVLMKIDISSSFSREEQITQIKKEAPEKLEQIGVNLDQEKIYYTFTP